MADKDREQAHYLAAQIERLEKNPYSFGFFQALRLIECLYPNAPRLGTSRKPGDDQVRLGQEPAMRFESASLSDFTLGSDGSPHKLSVRLFGLLGPNGPMPLHITEYVQERVQKFKDRTLVCFLDIFHHRMLSLFYRAWANNEPTVSYDRPESDRFADYVGSLEGIGMPVLRGRDEISDWTKLFYCGHMSNQAKCPEGLESIVTGYFELPASLSEFVGEWLPLPSKDVFRLGEDPSCGSLGESTILGPEIWSCQHKFRMITGPLGLEDYESFLPVGERIKHLSALVRNYSGDEPAWDMMLVLKWQEVPQLCLNGEYRLGWTTWLGKRPVEEDADDLVLNPSACINLQH